MRKIVLSAVMMLGMAMAISGCTASAEIHAGTPAPPPPPKPAPVAPVAPVVAKPAAVPEMGPNGLVLPGPVVFQTGSDQLKPESSEVLQVVKNYLDAKPDVTLMRIEGHTDNDGTAASNQTLSEKRSMAVARWLIGQGVKCDRLIAVGFGQTKPIAGNQTTQSADEKSQNRRVAFINAALKGRPIGGMPVDGSGGHVAGDPCKH
jgi:OmpA-OmpF porin, OOP family